MCSKTGLDVYSRIRKDEASGMVSEKLDVSILSWHFGCLFVWVLVKHTFTSMIKRLRPCLNVMTGSPFTSRARWVNFLILPMYPLVRVSRVISGSAQYISQALLARSDLTNSLRGSHSPNLHPFPQSSRFFFWRRKRIVMSDFISFDVEWSLALKHNS